MKIGIFFIVILLTIHCAKKTSTIDNQISAPVDSAAIKAAADQARIDSALALKEQFKREADSVLNPIYFSFDSYIINESSRNVLAALGNLMNKYSSIKLKIEGYCDERGSAEYNMALGQKRADEARKYLVAYGIAIERISTISWGEEKPADPGQNEAAWTKNRRDEFSVLDN